VSTVHIVPTSSLRFHMTLFVRSHREEAELSFDFEAEDIYAAGDKVLEIARHLGECAGVLDWKILSIVQVRNRRVSMPSHRFVVMVARGCLWLTLVPAEAAPSPLGGDS
jgi:hypothetical protein